LNLGIVTNPNNWCDANEKNGGTFCTFMWHADFLKILHKDATVVTGIIGHIATIFWKYAVSQ
jgi:hypothetical protein